jgi:hypothetical protein
MFHVCFGFICVFHNFPLVEQELLSLPEHLSSPPVLSGSRVIRCLVLCVCFVDLCFSFCTFSFGLCVVCSSSIYGFQLPLWFLQALRLTKTKFESSIQEGWHIRSRTLCHFRTHGLNTACYNIKFCSSF